MKRTTTTLSAVALAVIALSACGTTRTAAPTSQGTLPTPTLATSTPTTTAPPPPPASATPSVTTSTPAAARITTYPGDGVQVVKAADVRKLTGTSEAFRSFIAVTAKRAAADVIGTCWVAGRVSDLTGATGEAGLAGAGPGAGVVGRGCAGMIDVTPVSDPRKSPTRVSTNWLIEMLFVSQNAFSRS